MTQPNSAQPNNSGQPASPAESLKVMGASPAEVAATLQRETEALNAVIAQVQPRWNAVIPGREWTAAQEAEHILLVSEGGAKAAGLLLSGKELRQGPRVPVATDAQGRRQAPTSAQPSAEGQPWGQLQARHEAVSAALLQAATQAPETSERTLFHPALGDLDALGWLRVTAWHMRHHRKELQKLLSENGQTEEGQAQKGQTEAQP